MAVRVEEASSLWKCSGRMPLPLVAAFFSCPRAHTGMHMSFKEGTLLPYLIDNTRCTGCEDCVDACPMEAIFVDDRDHFSIDPEACTDCGTCADICPENAVRGS